MVLDVVVGPARRWSNGNGNGDGDGNGEGKMKSTVIDGWSQSQFTSEGRIHRSAGGERKGGREGAALGGSGNGDIADRHLIAHEEKNKL